MVSIPHDEKILAFWSWFQSVAEQLSENYDNPALLADLDAKVSELGNLAWELGPGSREENALAISPDGVAEWLPITQRIAAMAPAIPRWEFHPARPARDWNLEFSITASAGGDIDIDAREWRYVIFRFPDGTFDLILEQNNLFSASDEDRFTASVVLLDGLLGEARRLLWIRDVESVVNLPHDQVAKANPINVLPEHLNSLCQSPA